MPLPPIDVLLPVRNARRTLPAALADVLAQQDVRLRVLAVVDTDADGRDDGSAAWLAAAAAREPRLLLLRGPGRGAAAALQLGLEHCEAGLVGHMEADDRCPPDRLVRLATALVPPLAAVTSRAGQCGARTPGMRRYLDWQNGLLDHDAMAAARFVEIPALHQTGLYRRQALLAVGGYRCGGAWPVDIDFWLRWFEHELPVAKLPRVLYRWRQHAGQSTRGGAWHDLGSLRAAKLAALARLYGPAGRQPTALHLLSTGRTLEQWREALPAAGLVLAAADAWRPGQRLPPLAAGARRLAVYGMAVTRERLLAQLPDDERVRTIVAA